MGRPAKLNRPVDVHLRLPADLVGKVSILLATGIDGGVPLGSISDFYERAARKEIARIMGELKVTENGG
jgi:hypothetical protein